MKSTLLFAFAVTFLCSHVSAQTTVYRTYPDGMYEETVTAGAPKKFYGKVGSYRVPVEDDKTIRGYSIITRGQGDDAATHGRFLHEMAMDSQERNYQRSLASGENRRKPVIVEKQVIVEKIVEKPVDRIIERPVVVDRPVIVEVPVAVYPIPRYQVLTPRYYYRGY